ncbi:MAG: flagellar biosynthetic protein FliR [Chlamydiae bacterium]|nr:flagellar biosynthetic protein FliR [Chlamydiota bacterium]
MDSSLSSTDSYLSLLLSLPDISPSSLISLLFLGMARIIPIIVVAPFFGSKNLPIPVKIMFSLALIAILMPQLVFSVHKEIPFDIHYVGYFFKEILIGFILGFLAAIPFYVAQGSGSLTDYMRGAQALQVTDPTTTSQTGPIGLLYNYVLITSFFFIGGPFIFLDALAKSFELVPVNEFFNPIFFTTSMPIWHTILGLLNYVLSMSIQLAAPTLIGTLMAEMFLGIANRLAPQVQIVFLGISLKSWVGLALLAAAWYFIMQQLSKEAIAWLNVVQNTVYQMGAK